ncbi:MAG: hypothetical protein IPP77_09035 [Bacteroidetes bacterium]|nr:hypothetical protein [Bacteroidota bacterium]
MKTILFTIISIIFSLPSFSQNSDWQKSDRNGVYDEAMNLLSKYTHINQEQKQSVALCFLEEITKKYSKADYNAKIDAELKRIQSAALNVCSKNVGVELAIPKIEETHVPVKSEVNNQYLVGSWRTGLESFTFAESGMCLVENGSKSCSGAWTLIGKTVSINSKGSKWGKLDSCNKDRQFEIVTYTENEMIVLMGKEKVRLTREK